MTVSSEMRALFAWRRNHWPTRLALGLCVLAVLGLRLPLWLLPGPGRDEAAYHYWAHHPEPAYAPLLQVSVRLAELFGGHSLWTLRMPVLVLGFLVVALNDRRLATNGTPPALRWLGAMALAFSPWQGFASSVLHPDNFLFASLLGLILAVQHNRLWWATMAAVTAVLAKPTGVLFLPVMWWLAGHMEGIGTRQLWASRLVLVSVAAGLAMSLDPALVAGMADFGRLSGDLPWYDRVLAMGGSLLFLGGPLLVGWSWLGAHQRWRILRVCPADARQSEARASLAAAGILLAVFLAAILLRGQFKGNWVLPAVVLLWPVELPRPQVSPGFKRFAVGGLVTAFLCSLGQTALLTRPDLISRLENEVIARGLAPGWATYSTHAGLREKSVSTSGTWGDHLREFEDRSAFAAEIKSGWCDVLGATAPVTWIVAGDYGLACQLHWYLGDPATRVAIFDDKIFNGTWTDLVREAPQEPLLALSPRVVNDQPDGRLEFRNTLPRILHPVTGGTLQPSVVLWRTTPKQENPHDDLP